MVAVSLKNYAQRGRRVYVNLFAAGEAACWDIKGKIEGKPVWALLSTSSSPPMGGIEGGQVGSKQDDGSQALAHHRGYSTAR